MADDLRPTGQSPKVSTASRLERVPTPETNPDALPTLDEAETDADTARLRRLADRAAQPSAERTPERQPVRAQEREKTRTNERLSAAPQSTLSSSAQALEPAPSRLALGIMAKLAQAQTEGMEQPRPRPASAALGLALALAAAILLPLLGGLAYLILTGISTPGIFSDIARESLLLLADIWSALQAMAADARALVSAYPELPALAALLPLGIWGVRYTVRQRAASRLQKTGARLMRPVRGRGG